MTQMCARTAREDKAFGDGVLTQLGGGAIGDNPFTAGDMTDLKQAWDQGFQAAVGPAAWAISTAYTVGQLVTNDNKLYVCVVGGTSAGSGGPTGTGERIADNEVTWKYQNSDDNVDATRAGLTRAEKPAYLSVYP